MSSDAPPRARTVAVTLALFIASLLALYVGRFIQFDDTSGFNDDGFVALLAPVAALLVVAAFAVGLSEPVARRSLGGALTVLDIGLIAVAASDDGFRFFWTTYEGELMQFEVVLGLVALFLLAPSFRAAPEPAGREGHTTRGLTGWARSSLYLAALLGSMFVAFALGTAHFEATQCSGPDFGGECDLAGLEGLMWAGATLVLGIIVIVAVEVTRARRRGASRRPQTVGS